MWFVRAILVLLAAALLLGDLVTVSIMSVIEISRLPVHNLADFWMGVDEHVLGQTVEVLLLLGKFLLKLNELLLLALADGIVLGSALSSLEGITAREGSASASEAMGNSRGSVAGAEAETHPWPPVLGGEPVSPRPMARVVVLKEARRGRKAAVLAMVGRSIVGSERCVL